MAKDIELLQEIFIGGTRKYNCQTSSRSTVSAAGCLTVSCLFELVLFSKKKDVRGVRTRGIYVLYSILHSHC